MAVIISIRRSAEASAERHNALRPRQGAKRRIRYDDGLDALVARCVRDFHAGAVRKSHISKQNIVRAAFKQFPCTTRRVRSIDDVSGVDQDVLDDKPHVSLVLNQRMRVTHRSRIR